jgi:hypothetical protein
MQTPLPPNYRDCRRLLVHTEDTVRRFSRYHKYTVGTDLRQRAMQLMRTVNQAVHDKPRQAEHVRALVWQLDDYKLTLQLAMDIGAFSATQQGSKAATPARFAAFEAAATLAASVGKQCGGWWQALARRQRANQAGSSAAAGSTQQPPAAAHPASLSGCTTAAP